MDSVTIKWWLDKMLAIADAMARFTPTDVDNKIIAFMKSVVENPELLEVLTMLINMFSTKKMGDAKASVSVEDVVNALHSKGHLPPDGE